jgi:hypothetical protein
MIKQGLLTLAAMTSLSACSNRVEKTIKPEQLTTVERPEGLKRQLLQRFPEKDYDCFIGTDKMYKGLIIEDKESGPGLSYYPKDVANEFFHDISLNTELQPEEVKIYEDTEVCASVIEKLKLKDKIYLVKLTSEQANSNSYYAFAMIK